MNSETLIKAINYETLSLCLGGSEKEADRAYSLLPSDAPLTENLGDFAHVLGCTKTDVLEKFQIVRRAFEDMSEITQILCKRSV